ncbi:GIY-YIG nuclease family protein [Streptomyces sp. NBC_00474]|uniref:GIY-YIG nuclease family protein n=1 Tax=Streptomyces sp. NBC_00474 TaxID=2975754 RepID=UPI002258D4C5|nr:GIY-YIG nuclease family protein [Streptomyces sp. NBC_00474]MCX5055103.1 GIY-YIG nuclease family protein [Streptomyces sp. NBC_00474]
MPSKSIPANRDESSYGDTPLTPARATVSADVTIGPELAFAEGLQPEDYGVLVRLAMRGGPKTDLRSFASELRSSGWKMGADRLKTIVQRLEGAGYVRYQAQYNRATRRPEWVLEGALTPLFLATPPPRPRIPEARGWAYAVRETATGHIKIGSSRDPLKRLAALRTGAASPVDFVWLAEGGAALEAFLHAQFTDRRVRGEWFDLGDADAAGVIQQAAARFGGER